MKTRVRTFSLIASLFVLLGTYQNCAVHQSEARKQLEIIGFGSKAGDACLPYLTDEAAAAALSSGGIQDVVTKRIDDGTGSELSCLITVGGGQSSPLDVINCRVSSAERQYLDLVVRGTVDQSIAIRPTSEWTFQNEDRAYNDALVLTNQNGVGFWEVINNGTSSVFAAVGGPKNSTLAVRCYYTFSTAAGSQLTASVKTAAIQKSTMLLDELVVGLTGL